MRKSKKYLIHVCRLHAWMTTESNQQSAWHTADSQSMSMGCDSSLSYGLSNFKTYSHSPPTGMIPLGTPARDGGRKCHSKELGKQVLGGLGKLGAQ